MNALINQGPTSPSKNNVIHFLPDIMFRISKDGVIVEYFGGLQSLTLVQSPTLTGTLVENAFPPSMTNQIIESLNHTIDSGDVSQFEHHLTRNGRRYIVDCKMVRSAYEEGLLIIHDITDKVLNEKTIRRLSNTDPLTGLPNRQYFNIRSQLSFRVARQLNLGYAIILIDLDQFKRVNENLGHSYGDELLIEISSRLSQFPTSTLKNNSLSSVKIEIARLGGDEFSIFLRSQDALTLSETIAKNLLSNFNSPIRCGKNEVYVSPSIGIAIYPQHGNSIEALVNAASKALRSVKKRGRNNYEISPEKLEGKKKQNISVETLLRGALERDEFELHYQPQIDLRTQKIAGAEILLRWNSPKLGYVSPLEFIPIAEESGLINLLGSWVLQQSIEQISKWRYTRFESQRISVNISGHQFKNRDFSNLLADFITDSDIDPRLLGIEATESVIMDDVNCIIKILHDLCDMGVEVSIDDFGTGYSSLSYLKKLPIKTIKIDRSFVKNIPSNNDDKTIVKAVNNLAHNLNLRTVAEGVETAEQLDFMKSIDCDIIQGFYFSKPLPLDEFEVYFTHFNKI
ncbi:MAG: EAL domain-containing protein [Gammaproteobacteria bacterium]|nr:EAL domain-containing protein [Gammaproteobacteria bacterium]